jgi:hypothetical protein
MDFEAARGKRWAVARVRAKMVRASTTRLNPNPGSGIITVVGVVVNELGMGVSVEFEII